MTSTLQPTADGALLNPSAALDPHGLMSFWMARVRRRRRAAPLTAA
jgi:hypothetical protein